MPATTGRFTSGPNKGRRWELYRDDSSPTGWVRKIWSPTDTSNGGRPTEYFENYDYAADEEDEQTEQQARARQAAARERNRAEAQAAKDRADAGLTAEKNSEYRYRDTRDRESDRRFNVQQDLAERTRQDRIEQIREAAREQKRQFDLEFAREKEVSDREFGLDTQRFGHDILKTGAGMRGALQWAQGDAYAQGVAGSGLSPFVAALRGGTPVQYGGGTATQGNPTPLTVSTLANVLTGQAVGGTDAYGRPRLSPDVQAGVDAASGVFQKGLSTMPLGFLENMTPGQRDAFRSAGAWLGRDVDAEEEYYRRSRPSQRSALLG